MNFIKIQIFLFVKLISFLSKLKYCKKLLLDHWMEIRNL